MLIPYCTDAPVYHRPVGTIGLMVVNTLVFLILGPGPRGPAEPLWLSLGDGLHPLEWLTSVFVHGDVFHLLGNMLFLWVFGLVVEGKLGWKAFLACYLGVGVAESIVFQAMRLHAAGPPFYAGGASAAIFGLMAMAAVWAPANSIEHKWLVPYDSFYWMWWDMPRTALDRDGDMTTISVRIDVLAGVYVALNLLDAARGSGTGMAHLGGAAFGLPLGIALLSAGVVDCEGWDVFSLLLQRRRGHFDEVLADRERSRGAADARRRIEERRGEARGEFRRLLAESDFVGAQRARTSPEGGAAAMPLDAAEFERLARGLCDARAWPDAAAVIDEYLRACPFGTDRMRITLAQIRAAHLDDPAGALEVLEGIDAESLTPEEAARAAKITAKVRAMIAAKHRDR